MTASLELRRVWFLSANMPQTSEMDIFSSTRILLLLPSLLKALTNNCTMKSNQSDYSTEGLHKQLYNEIKSIRKGPHKQLYNKIKSIRKCPHKQLYNKIKSIRLQYWRPSQTTVQQNQNKIRLQYNLAKNKPEVKPIQWNLSNMTPMQFFSLYTESIISILNWQFSCCLNCKK